MNDFSTTWCGSGRIAVLHRHNLVDHRRWPAGHRRKPDRGRCMQAGRLMIAFGGPDGWCSDGPGPERRDEGSRDG